MKLEIVTPDQKLFEGEAQSVTLPGTMGAFQVLDRHAPLISTLENGEVSIAGGKSEPHFFATEGAIRAYEGKDGSEHAFFIEGGVVEVLNDQVVVLAEDVVAKK